MVSLVIIIALHGNNVYAYAHEVLFTCIILVKYTYDIEIFIATIYNFISGFAMCPSIIHGKILVVNN